MDKRTVLFKKGQKIGNCFYIKELEKIKRERRCLFKCACGKQFSAFLKNVQREKTKSCGCYLNSMLRNRIKHGLTRKGNISYFFRIRQGMIRRTTLPHAQEYKYYGGRGIKVCKRWLESLQNFVDDMGPRPSDKHSIDRIKNNKGYTPKNCRWATKKEQQQNTSRNIFITLNGERFCASEWCRKIELADSTLGKMLKRGHKFKDIVAWKKTDQRFFYMFMRGKNKK